MIEFFKKKIIFDKEKVEIKPGLNDTTDVILRRNLISFELEIYIDWVKER